MFHVMDTCEGRKDLDQLGILGLVGHGHFLKILNFLFDLPQQSLS